MTGFSKPTLKELCDQAKRFGPDQVAETAAQWRYSVEEVARVIEACDEAEHAIAKKKSRYATRKKHKLSYEERAKRLLGITDEEEEQT